MNCDSNVKVLSVQPGQLPAGLKNPEMTVRFLRQRGIAASVMETRNSRTADMIFGASANRSVSGRLLSSRMVGGAALIVLSALAMFGVVYLPMWFAVSLAIYSLCLISGTVVRISGMLLASSGALLLLSGVTGMFAALCLVASVAVATGFSITGPGRYSVDRHLQRKLRERLIESETRGRHLDDYRAFSRL